MFTSRRSQRGVLTVLVATVALAAVPALASATTVTLSDDSGTPQPLNPAAPPTIRNITPDVAVSFPPGGGRYRFTVTDAAGTAAGIGIDCIGKSFAESARVEYHGNGAYLATITNFADNDSSCKTPLSTEQYPFTITGATALTAPVGAVLLRAPGSYSTNTITVPIALNPGADSYEVLYAANGIPGPDGGLPGAQTASVDTTTGSARLNVTTPGVYTVVARAERFTAAGNYFTPFSAPIKVVVVAPFDLSGVPEFLDSRGPSYKLRFALREKTARGKVYRSRTRKKTGKYHSLGTAKISSKGTFLKRFRATKLGVYRVRLTYKGSQTIAPAKIVIGIVVHRI